MKDITKTSLFNVLQSLNAVRGGYSLTVYINGWVVVSRKTAGATKHVFIGKGMAVTNFLVLELNAFLTSVGVGNVISCNTPVAPVTFIAKVLDDDARMFITASIGFPYAKSAK